MARYRESVWEPGGYRSYADYRAHDYGRIPADRPGLSGEDRAEAMGHRGPAALDAALRSGRVAEVEVTGEGRDARGRFDQISIRVTMADGTVRHYRRVGKDASPRQLQRLGKRLDRKGIPAVWYPVNVARGGRR